ncbi:hypothetical protein HN695_04855 [Candidatus Woesearchaeota archaeon]|jgi:hypothetical protein|nr:hypothetical protein [Candidatus Woesearchaeota archaeon]MBT5272053.1 hypothetical protein [Candidatus Woesearchaeota archaeon]MBT6041803.1 hypothetical protein [Candidatus Woesearchaeota archaeon]MBT6336822.1 hypothetical protein [Candidatus Woesearchaeota archaeon]MBT7927643.1 hypothetical protein [Candidatus Woesearchaeota archaeon]
MADFNKDELMKLSPAERIKKLKELELERKKEIKDLEKKREEEGEEADKLLKQAEQEMTKKAFAEAKPPEDIRQFTTPKLEDTIAKEKIPDIPAEENIKYANPFDSAVDLYNKIKTYAARDDPITGDDAQTVGYLYDVFNEVVDDINEKEQKIEQVASSMKRMVKDIMGEYHANVKYNSE